VTVTALPEAGIGSASGGGISHDSGASHSPSLAIAPDGTLYVAWHDDTSGDCEIYVELRLQFDKYGLRLHNMSIVGPKLQCSFLPRHQAHSQDLAQLGFQGGSTEPVLSKSQCR
jgi:hypothetical protein